MRRAPAPRRGLERVRHVAEVVARKRLVAAVAAERDGHVRRAARDTYQVGIADESASGSPQPIGHRADHLVERGSMRSLVVPRLEVCRRQTRGGSSSLCAASPKPTTS